MDNEETGGRRIPPALSGVSGLERFLFHPPCSPSLPLDLDGGAARRYSVQDGPRWPQDRSKTGPSGHGAPQCGPQEAKIRFASDGLLRPQHVLCVLLLRCAEAAARALAAGLHAKRVLT